MPHHPSRKEFLKTVASGAVLVSCAGMGVGCAPELSEKLSIKPSKLRGDEPFVVRLWDLSPGERVVLTVAFDDDRGKEWSSTATFEVDGEGKVDTSKQAPVKGYYSIRDPMGLVWSALGPGFEYIAPLRSSPVRVKAEVGDEKAEAQIEHYILAEGAHTEDVREGGLVGRLFSPAGQDSVPGMLVVGGSEGGIAPYVEREAALLASRGYAALALAYFKGEYYEPEGAEGLPDTLVRVPLEYFGRALQWLGGRRSVRGDRLGVVGHSRGGELALLLGATYRELKSVVSYVGSGVVVHSPEGNEPAWTYRGEEVEWLPDTEDPSTLTREQEEEITIPVERTNGPVLLIAAGGDSLWPSVSLSKIAVDRLKRHHRPYEDQLLIYPDAGHLIQAPYVPTAPSATSFGGDAKANAEADEDSWGKVLALLGGSLKG
jgi:dienelactone hydrolase